MEDEDKFLLREESVKKLPDGVPPCPGGPPSHIRRWESQYAEQVRAWEAGQAVADAADGIVEEEEPEVEVKPVAKKKAKKKAKKSGKK